jgi:hypothetical protein
MSCVFAFCSSTSGKSIREDTIMSYRFKNVSDLFYYPSNAVRAIVICENDGTPCNGGNKVQVRFYDYNNNYIISKYVTIQGDVFFTSEDFCNFVRCNYSCDGTLKEAYPILPVHKNMDRSDIFWYPDGSIKALLITQELNQWNFYNSHGVKIGVKEEVDRGGEVIIEYSPCK